MKYLNVLSRFFVSIIFLLSALGKLMNFSGTAQMMSTAGFPFPQLFLIGAIFFELAGGLLLLAGFQTRLAAIGLIVFLVPATLIFHASQIGDPLQGQQQMAHFLKNVAILGALLKFYIDGAGELSVDAKQAKEGRPLAESQQAA